MTCRLTFFRWSCSPDVPEELLVELDELVVDELEVLEEVDAPVGEVEALELEVGGGGEKLSF